MLKKLSIFASAVLALVVTSTSLLADSCVMPRPRPAPSTAELSSDGTTTTIITPTTTLPEGDSFGPEPANLLPTVYANVCDVNGEEIPNTLPSTPEQPYNLHPEPHVTTIDKTSPTDDLAAILKELRQVVGDPQGGSPEERAGHGSIDPSRVQFAIDIIEGNPLPVPRAYSGFPILHYIGPLKTKTVEPILDGSGNVIGGTVVINQVWYDSHIESDTSYVDSSSVADVPWTIHYNVHVLNRGADDFASFMIAFDDVKDLNGQQLPHVALDQTFFPMLDGQKVEFEMKMPPSRFWNLTYHWGWRRHPPRVQVVENMNVKLIGNPRNAFEIGVFGEDPRASETAKLDAINMIGDLAPEKRMWNAFRKIAAGASGKELRNLVTEAEQSFDDWQHRTRLPRGVKADPDADMTLFFANNTIYGQIKGQDDGTLRDMQRELHKWKKRGETVKMELLNADYFPKAFIVVDFGGTRGWENTFHNTLPVGGSGPWFTFGRAHWWLTGGPVMLPDAPRPLTTPGKKYGMDKLQSMWNNSDATKFMKFGNTLPSQNATTKGVAKHNVVVTFNYDPPARLRLYTGDALHHDTAVWSAH
ncbi:hypothetical protein [Nitrosomonas sp. Is37]|uniref:hypothetical protein n=1 Tax=Nitrosomonas sp. Is37 TaxID=3080535 RepID=UPI00294B40D8|nr:hypothetical protein [Nitrosomonas sp. Is37]MDV6345393.1 hypothetical protein [Nitrosomonas sp. Is37]